MATLNAQVREAGKANRLRLQGQVPAVVYGPTMESLPLAIEERELRALFAKVTRSTRINLSVGEGDDARSMDVFVKAIQYDSTTDRPTHVDFYHADEGRPLKLNVPIKTVGEAEGVKSGGVLNVIARTVRVLGLPKDIPPIITIDVSELDLHDSVRIKDIDFGGVEPLLPPERTLVTVLAPRGIEVEVTAAEEELEGIALGAEEGGEEEAAEAAEDASEEESAV